MREREVICKRTERMSKKKQCYCGDGILRTECCSGRNCSCGGQVLEMGPCRVCDGTGWMKDGANGRDNISYLRGFGGYIGRSLDGSRRLGE